MKILIKVQDRFEDPYDLINTGKYWESLNPLCGDPSGARPYPIEALHSTTVTKRRNWEPVILFNPVQTPSLFPGEHNRRLDHLFR
jgi:hypothetical protein